MSHGHVTPNADGSKARCGGPAICSECAREQAAVWAERPHERELAGILIGMTYQTADRLAREKRQLLDALYAVEEWIVGDLGPQDGCCPADDLCAGHETLRLVRGGLALELPDITAPTAIDR